MSYDNMVLKAWLRKVGPERRKIILLELKRDLDKRGLTQHQVFEALRQLVARSPYVRLTRLNTLRCPRYRSSETSVIEDTRKSSNIQPETIDREVHRSPDASPTIADNCEPTTAKRLKTNDDASIVETPELLDEKVGSGNPLLVRIPRTAITLNLNSYATAKKNLPQARQSPEIRLADSSVPDLSPTEKNLIKEKCVSSMNKPKIVEDLTCLDGTMFSRSSLQKISQCPSSPDKIEEKTKTETTKESRLNEKFRKLFGTDVTVSESDEEKRLIAKLTSKKRRKESRMSSDSGVCLGDLASDSMLSEMQENKPVIISDVIYTLNEDKREFPETIIEEKADATCNEALPDSSTNFEDKPSLPADSSSSTKLTILITPVNAQDDDAFDPLCLELDLSKETQISTPTSTTPCIPIVETTKIEKSFEDLENLLAMDVTKDCHISMKSNTIRIHEDISSLVAAMEDEEDDDVEEENRLIIDDSSLTEGLTSSQSRGDSATLENMEERSRINETPEINSENESSTRKTIMSEENIENSCNEMNVSKNIENNEFTTDQSSETDKDSLTQKIIDQPTEVLPNNSTQKVIVISSTFINIDNPLTLEAIKSQTINENERISNFESLVRETCSNEPIATSNRRRILPKPSKNLESVTSESQPQVSENDFTNRSKISESATPKTVPEITTSKDIPTSQNDLTNRAQIIECPNSGKSNTPPEIAISKDIPTAPKIRLLHHSELGSRWCPTPLDTNPRQSQRPNPAIPSQPQFYLTSQYFPNAHPTPLDHMQRLAVQSSIPNHVVQDSSHRRPPPDYPMMPSNRVCNNNLNFPQVSPLTLNRASLSPSNDRLLIPAGDNTLVKILEYFIYLSKTIDQIKMGKAMYRVFELHMEFNKSKKILFQLLMKYGTMIGNQSIDVVVESVMAYYHRIVPLDRRYLTIHKIRNVFTFDNQQVPNNGAQISPGVSSGGSCQVNRSPASNPRRRFSFDTWSRPEHSLLTEAQFQTLKGQIEAYKHQYIVLHYQLVAQREAEEATKRNLEAAKPKRARRSNKRATPTQNPYIQASRVTVETVNPPVQQMIPNSNPVLITQQINNQHSFEDTIEAIIRTQINEGGNVGGQNVVRPESSERAIEQRIAETIQDLYRIHPEGRNCGEERISSNQGIVNNAQRQVVGSSLQGQSVDNVQSQTMVKDLQVSFMESNLQRSSVENNVRRRPIGNNLQLPSVENNSQRPFIENNAQRLFIENNVQRLFIESNSQRPFIGNNPQGPLIGNNLQLPSVENNPQRPFIETNNQRSFVENNPQGPLIENNPQRSFVENNPQGQSIENNAQRKSIENNAQHQDIESNHQFETLESNVQLQLIEMIIKNKDAGAVERNIDQPQAEAKNVEDKPNELAVRDEIIDKNSSNVSPTPDRNVQNEAVETNSEDQTIEEEMAQLESVLNRSDASPQERDTNVVEVLKELEHLNSLTGIEKPKAKKFKEDIQVTSAKETEDCSKTKNLAVQDKIAIEEVGGEKTDASAVPEIPDSVKSMESTKEVPVITLDDADDWDVNSVGSASTVRDVEMETIDEISILEVKSISKDVFNSMNETFVVIDNGNTIEDERMIVDDETVMKSELSDCFRCGRQSSVVCEQCRIAVYCSPDCHQLHWTEAHYLSCKPTINISSDIQEMPAEN